MYASRKQVNHQTNLNCIFQVLGESYNETLKILWREERWNILTKGISARMTTSCLFSLMIAFGYESVKRFSLKEEFKADVRW